MRDALRRADHAEYLRLLSAAALLVPLAPGQRDAVRAAAGEAPISWGAAKLHGHDVVLAYTSPAAMTASTGGSEHLSRRVTIAELAAAWPNPTWWLGVNPGLPIEGCLPPRTVADLAAGTPASLAGATPAGLATGVPPARAAGTPPAPTAGMSADQATGTPGEFAAGIPGQPDPSHGPVVMQKTVHPAHLGWYLDNHGDRVSGYVHRMADLRGLDTPYKLVDALGLGGSGGLFDPVPDQVYVLRWPVVGAALYRVPFGGPTEQAMLAMPDGWVVEDPPFVGTGFAPNPARAIPEFKVDSIPLPHGAELHQISATRRQRPCAVFDADWRRWVPVRAQQTAATAEEPGALTSGGLVRDGGFDA